MKKKLVKLMASFVIVMGTMLAIMGISANADTMYVSGASTGAVYLRTAPASSNYYCTLNNGTQVQTIGWQRGWDGYGYTQVTYGYTTGWIKSMYLSYGYSSGSSSSSSKWYSAYISGASTGRVYIWSSAYGSGYVTTIPNGSSIRYKSGTYTNGRVYGHCNGVYGWFTYTYVYPY